MMMNDYSTDETEAEIILQIRAKYFIVPNRKELHFDFTVYT